MEIRSPERVQGSPSESVILTPFKVRALEEQRLRDSLILSLTPGLKRRSEVQASVAPLHNDRLEIRSYLQDLSSALASRDGGRNLTEALMTTSAVEPDGQFNSRLNTFNATQGSVLEDEVSMIESRSETQNLSNLVESTKEPDVVESPEDADAEPSAKDRDIEEDEPEQIDVAPLTLSQQILAGAPRIRSGAKIRKLEPVYIPGVNNTAGKQEQAQSPETLPNPFVNTGSIPESNGGSPPHEFDDMPSPMADFDMDGGGAIMGDGPGNIAQQVPQTETFAQQAPFTETIPQHPTFPTTITQSDVFTEPPPLSKVRPVSLAQLHRSLDTFTSSHNIKLNKSAWKSLQTASVPVIEAMAHGLDRTGNGIITPSHPQVRSFLEQYGTLMPGASSNDLFALCSAHMTSEELNDLERDWS